MNSFSFILKLNPTLTQDVNLIFDGIDTYVTLVNELCDIENLIASFTTVGGGVQVNNVAQLTGVSSNDFKDDQIGYRVYIDIASFMDWYVIKEIAKRLNAQ